MCRQLALARRERIRFTSRSAWRAGDFFAGRRESHLKPVALEVCWPCIKAAAAVLSTCSPWAERMCRIGTMVYTIMIFKKIGWSVETIGTHMLGSIEWVEQESAQGHGRRSMPPSPPSPSNMYTCTSALPHTQHIQIASPVPDSHSVGSS